MHPFIHILGKEIPMYSICIMTGMLVAGGVIALLSKKFSVKRDDALYSYIYAILVMVAGAKILYILVNIPNLPEMIEEVGFTGLMQGGFVVYGGILGAFLGVAIYGWQFKLDSKPLYSVLIVGLPLAQAFGRIGCFMAGCCYGRETTSACHIVFTHSHFAPNNVWLYPTQIMSAAGNFINFLLLVFVIDKLFKNRRGIVTSFFLIFYSVGRFVIEIFRGDLERGFVGSLSTSQFVSIFIFAAGIVLFVICMRLPKVSEEPVAEVSGETEASDRDTDDSKTEE
ncbi:MAG: prolipoprotein diacylglyceryl transferase [Treponema sp.]|nr:prolipoprotein diacylglyceryl transferase [Treponema sp.]